jgi:hypothetical protein
VPESPVEQLLQALDDLDVDAAMALMAPRIHMLSADGRSADGSDAVRALITDFIGGVRSMTHRITAHWHPDNIWIAEVEATYELSDWLRTAALPRAFFVRAGPQGISDLHVYGAHEAPLADHDERQGGTLVGGRWMPPL